MALLVKICKIINDNLALIDFPTSTNVTASDVDFYAGVMQRGVSCHSGVNAGDPVRMTTANLAIRALATNVSNANFVGICVLKETQTMCTIRFAGQTSAIYSNLITNADYYLSTAGGITDTAPGSGTVVLRAGTAFTSQNLVIYKGIMTQKA